MATFGDKYLILFGTRKIAFSFTFALSLILYHFLPEFSTSSFQFFYNVGFQDIQT